MACSLVIITDCLVTPACACLCGFRNCVSAVFVAIDLLLTEWKVCNASPTRSLADSLATRAQLRWWLTCDWPMLDKTVKSALKEFLPPPFFFLEPFLTRTFVLRKFRSESPFPFPSSPSCLVYLTLLAMGLWRCSAVSWFYGLHTEALQSVNSNGAGCVTKPGLWPRWPVCAVFCCL